MNMLELHDIETGYGAGQVLFGVSLIVAAGACVSLMGRNGMGKTTTVRAIMGQCRLAWDGSVGLGMIRDRPSFDVRAGIGLVPEGRQIFEPHGAKIYKHFTVLLPARLEPSGILSGCWRCFRVWLNVWNRLVIICLVVNSKCWRLDRP